MAKRFIDTDLFKKRWLRELKAPYKLLYIYLFTDCNHCGVWEVDLEIAGIRLGFPDLKNEEQEIIEAMGNQITVFKNGQKWWLKDFCDFQYGDLKETNRMHLSVIESLRKSNIYELYLNRNKTLASPLQGVKDKVKDKVKVKVKEKEEIKLPFDSESFFNYWGIWKDYKAKEFQFKYKSPQSEQAALMKLNNLANGIEQAAIQIIDEAMANGWKGLFKLEKNGKQIDSKRQEAEQRLVKETMAKYSN